MIQCILFKFRKWHTCNYEWYRLYRSYENCRRPGVAILDMQMSKVPIISGYVVRSPGRSYTAERVTFLIILEVLLATWNSDNFVPFWQYHYAYGLTRNSTSLTTQTAVPPRQISHGRKNGHVTRYASKL